MQRYYCYVQRLRLFLIKGEIMKKKVIPITLLTGYLGAGKTTLLNYVLNNKEDYKVAVIVNDIGEVNIDASLIAAENVVSQADDSLVPLQNGCICCDLKQDLMKQIAELVASNKFDYILIEASGICEPIPIVQSIAMVADASEEYNLPSVCKLDNVVSVVDCLRLAKEFGCGNDLVEKRTEAEDIENLIIQQIEFCNKIILNKIDQVTEDEKNMVKAVIKKLQPDAELLEAEFGKVPMNKIMGTNSFDFDKACTSAGWLKEIEKEADENDDGHEEHHHEHDEHHSHEHEHEDGEHHEHEHHHHDHKEGEECEICKHEHDEEHGHKHHHHHHHHHHGEGDEEYGIGTFVYYRRKPLIRSRFRQFVDSMPKNIIRSKGIAWYSNDNDNMYIFEQAGPQKTSFKADFWIDALPEPQKKVYVMQNPDIMKDWQDGIGDRMVKIVFIGQKMDKEAIFKALDECLDK